MKLKRKKPSPEQAGPLTNRTAIFEALAQGLDIPQVLDRFQLTRRELEEIFLEVAHYCRAQDQGFWRLYCDGASRGNPGPAGAGIALYNPQGELQAEQGEFLGETTNNVAEYQALLLGLKTARNLKITRVQIFLDSELLVKQVTGHYRVKSPHLLPLWQQAKKELQKFEAYAISHVPRRDNRLADRLANHAIDQKYPSR
jgi:ribonuclease HI